MKAKAEGIAAEDMAPVTLMENLGKVCGPYACSLTACLASPAHADSPAEAAAPRDASNVAAATCALYTGFFLRHICEASCAVAASLCVPIQVSAERVDEWRGIGLRAIAAGEVRFPTGPCFPPRPFVVPNVFAA